MLDTYGLKTPSDFITLLIAVIGLVLSVLNLWIAVQKDKVRISLRPTVVYKDRDTGREIRSPHSLPAMRPIELELMVTNLSSFEIYFGAVNFVLAENRRLPVLAHAPFKEVKWRHSPILPRQSLYLTVQFGADAFANWRGFRGIEFVTQCGHRTRVRSTALAAWMSDAVSGRLAPP